jgi:hypothetical protein
MEHPLGAKVELLLFKIRRRNIKLNHTIIFFTNELKFEIGNLVSLS